MDFVPFAKHFDVDHWIVVKKSSYIFYFYVKNDQKCSWRHLGPAGSSLGPIGTCLQFYNSYNSNYFVSSGDKSQES